MLGIVKPFLWKLRKRFALYYYEYKELFVQEYSKPPDTTGGMIFKYADRELYDTALFVFNVKMRPVYEVKGIKVRF